MPGARTALEGRVITHHRRAVQPGADEENAAGRLADMDLEGRDIDFIFPGTWAALPLLPTWLLRIGVAAVLVLTFFLFVGELDTPWQWVGHILVVLAWILPGLVITAALLRVIAYFRDNYRAQTYGVPDLVEIIRKIDAEIVARDAGRKRGDDARVQLSFIGHSMGGFVVTNAIRVLTDLFGADAMHRQGREPEFVDEEVVAERVFEPKPVPKAFATPRSDHIRPAPENGNNGHAHARAAAPAAPPGGTGREEKVRLARLKGYEGDPCGECGQLTLVRNGACLKCDTCGATTGCS